MTRFTTDNSLLLMIDIQERLTPVMHESERLISKTETLLKIADTLKIPALITEQVPDKLGATLPALTQLITPLAPAFSKTLFSAITPEVEKALIQAGRSHVIITGIESHVCVTQSTLDLIKRGYLVGLVEDAMSSRDPLNHANAMSRLTQAGAIPLNVETIAFELLQDATHPDFRAVSKLIK